MRDGCLYRRDILDQLRDIFEVGEIRGIWDRWVC